MLELWIGRANTGKSRRVLEAVRRRGESGRRQLILVPEHASHQAELDLCRVCGPGASAYGEVLSPRRLCQRVLAAAGGLAEGTLDAGGKILMMQMAVVESLSELKVYARPSRKAPFLSELVALCDELQAYHVAPDKLGEICEVLGGLSGDKLRDLSIIYAAYLRRLEDGEDRRDLMEKLAEKLPGSGFVRDMDVYLDGFSYFTVQEERILEEILRSANSLTVTLMGDKTGSLPIFEQSIRTRDKLCRLAQDMGVETEITYLPPAAEDTPLRHLEACFFGETSSWEGPAEEVTLYKAEDPFSEVEYVAGEILALVRSGQYRFRDIAVAARNLDEYAPVIEDIFARYEIPVYLSRRSDILEKPILSLIAGALDAVVGGYEYEDMFRWLKTGLAGLTDEECDILENYVILWDIHGAMWARDEDWTANPAGWREGFSPEEQETLDLVNSLRHRVCVPLSRLARGMREEKGARGKLQVLWQFLEDLGLGDQLRQRTDRLEELGELQRAMEYSQLWELLGNVMDQFSDILGDTELSGDEFARLFKLVLTQYDVGTIPVSLDQVQATQITRNDRHQVRCLFLMGANDHVLPAVNTGTGLLTREDRESLQENGVELAPTGEELFNIELQNLYGALSQPSERLTVTYPGADFTGAALRPSFVVGRIRSLLPGCVEKAGDGTHPYRLTAPRPALEMAGTQRGGALWTALRASGEWEREMDAMERAARMTRGRLSRSAVETLYGKSYRMSASRVDKVNSCHFAYFMEYGLRAKERTPAGFDAAQVGTFLHYVLEHVVQEAGQRGGVDRLETGELGEMISASIERYMGTSMPGFDKRDARFKYIFHRLRRTVTTIVENVSEELQEGEFVPIAFELEFSDKGQLPAIAIKAGDASLTLSGKVDRVDGWLKDDKLYLRVVDYKSGKKAFDLADVYHGLNIQMLLYLFALEKGGKALFGHDIVPAGVLYLPARDALVGLSRDTDAAVVQAALDKELRRSGLVLSHPEVLKAMEHSALEEPRFLPLALGRDGSITKGVASAEELGKLSRYVDSLLVKVARELREGNIDADPVSHGPGDDACTYCEFASACHFMEEDPRDHLDYIRPIRPQEFWEHVDETIGEEEKR